MPAKRYSKESIVRDLRSLARRLDTRVLSGREIESVLARSTVHYYFGNLSNALEAAGLERIDTSTRRYHRDDILTDDVLFESLRSLEVRLGHEPGHNEYNAKGQFSAKPFRRFGRWPDVLDKYRLWRSTRVV